MVSCTDRFEFGEKAVQQTQSQGAHLRRLFSQTKLLCFGRYVLKVPAEAQLLSGSYGFPSYVRSHSGDESSIRSKIVASIQRIKFASDDAEITYSEAGPVESSWQIRYFDSGAAKEVGLQLFEIYIILGDTVFEIGNAAHPEQSEATTAEIEAVRAKSLRLRGDNDVPNEEGYCVEHAFMASSFYGHQETVNVGIYFPSLPDVAFSVSSNKDAYADYSRDEFEKVKRHELSLLSRISAAQEKQGSNYPRRTVLREGGRKVQHWTGEESLIKRPDGVHDFEWGFVGTPKDVANPSELIVSMFTKVEHNVVGAASKASLSDDEAIALWDELLSGLKFRVKVPGAPEGSYVLPQK
jgi:hypothetical protein